MICYKVFNIVSAWVMISSESQYECCMGDIVGYFQDMNE